jgi:hypothetical protein
MLRVTAEELLARGYTTGLMTIATDNHASCRAAEKGGAQRRGMLSARRRLGRWVTHFEPFAPRSLPLAESDLDQDVAA